MNAYELADELERVGCTTYCRCEETIPMLRQQADRIERLEAEAKAKNNYLEQHCQKIDQQADRIAELEKDLQKLHTNAEFELDRAYWKIKELTKPLSDEEIMEIFKAYEQMQEYGYVGKKPFQVSLGWSLSERNDCLMLARAIEERHGIK